MPIWERKRQQMPLVENKNLRRSKNCGKRLAALGERKCDRSGLKVGKRRKKLHVSSLGRALMHVQVQMENCLHLCCDVPRANLAINSQINRRSKVGQRTNLGDSICSVATGTETEKFSALVWSKAKSPTTPHKFDPQRLQQLTFHLMRTLVSQLKHAIVLVEPRCASAAHCRCGAGKLLPRWLWREAGLGEFTG